MLMNSVLTEADNLDIPRIELPRLSASVFTEHTFLCRHECFQSLDEHGFLKVKACFAVNKRTIELKNT